MVREQSFWVEVLSGLRSLAWVRLARRTLVCGLVRWQEVGPVATRPVALQLPSSISADTQ